MCFFNTDTNMIRCTNVIVIEIQNMFEGVKKVTRHAKTTFNNKTSTESRQIIQGTLQGRERECLFRNRSETIKVGLRPRNNKGHDE
jgi:hypothetical protein